MAPRHGRQHDREGAAPAGRRRDLDRAAVSVHDPLHQAQAEPAAARLARHGFRATEEGLEEVRHLGGGNAVAPVFDRDADLALALGPDDSARSPTNPPSPPWRIAFCSRFATARRRAERSARTRGQRSTDAALDREAALTRERLERCDALREDGLDIDVLEPPLAMARVVPARSSTRSTISARRRPSSRTTRPYSRAVAGSVTTPAARLSPAAQMTARGVRSSCETPATNSTCRSARRRARWAETTIKTALARSRARTPPLTARLRRRTAATTASTEPARCRARRRQWPGWPPRRRAASALRRTATAPRGDACRWASATARRPGRTRVASSSRMLKSPTVASAGPSAVMAGSEV